MQSEQKKEFLLTGAYYAVLAAALYLFLRYLLWWLLPFLLAFAAARAMEPVILLLRRTVHFKRAFSAALLREKGLSTDVAIASDNFHQLRAAIWAQRSGLTPYSDGCASPWFLTAGYWARETALLYMVVTGG